MPQVQTVRGPVDTADLGRTSGPPVVLDPRELATARPMLWDFHRVTALQRPQDAGQGIVVALSPPQPRPRPTRDRP